MTGRRTNMPTAQAPGTGKRRTNWRDDAACGNAPAKDVDQMTSAYLGGNHASWQQKFRPLRMRYCDVCPVKAACLNWAYDEQHFTGLAGGVLFLESHKDRKRKMVKV